MLSEPRIDERHINAAACVAGPQVEWPGCLLDQKPKDASWGATQPERTGEQTQSSAIALDVCSLYICFSESSGSTYSADISVSNSQRPKKTSGI